jgi:hypothetical protein
LLLQQPIVDLRDSEKAFEQHRVMPADGVFWIQHVIKKLRVFDNGMISVGQEHRVKANSDLPVRRHATSGTPAFRVQIPPMGLRWADSFSRLRHQVCRVESNRGAAHVLPGQRCGRRGLEVAFSQNMKGGTITTLNPTLNTQPFAAAEGGHLSENPDRVPRS